MDTQTVINNCKIENNIIKLPSVQLDRNTYMEAANKLKKIGGKWKGGKVQGFVFDYNPTDLLADLQGGKERNIKKEFQFFETPRELAKKLILAADLTQRFMVLEPSAGRGAIVREIPDDCKIHAYEINPLYHDQLESISNLELLGTDFLQADEYIKYSRIVANPPFSKNQDIDHIRKMYAVLATGGIMVSIASTHYQHSNNRKETEFRNWLEEVGAEVFEVEAGAFKESGTNIETVIIRIRK